MSRHLAAAAIPVAIAPAMLIAFLLAFAHGGLHGLSDTGPAGRWFMDAAFLPARLLSMTDWTSVSVLVVCWACWSVVDVACVYTVAEVIRWHRPRKASDRDDLQTTVATARLSSGGLFVTLLILVGIPLLVTLHQAVAVAFQVGMVQAHGPRGTWWQHTVVDLALLPSRLLPFEASAVTTVLWNLLIWIAGANAVTLLIHAVIRRLRSPRAT